jgi:o-succinylbenzoate synthase
MNQIGLTYLPYSLKFRKPFETANKTFTKRKGFIITIKDPEKIKGVGDAAPLSEFGSESLEDDEKFLKEFKLKLKIDLNNFEDSLLENLAQLEKYPALRHGFEQAFLNYVCSKTNVSLNELLNRESSRSINVNAVIGFNSIEDIIKITREILDNGYKTLKIKVGRENFKDDFKTVEEIRNIAGPGINLRIDANGKWSFENAKNNLKKLEKFNIEYCEQPVSKSINFIRLKEQTPIPLAADESIHSVQDADDFITTNAASALILKPMMLGGIISTMKIADRAKKKKIKVVISSSFESVVGRSFAILVASFLKDKTAHGLGTAKLFENDLIEDPYPVKNGMITLG